MKSIINERITLKWSYAEAEWKLKQRTLVLTIALIAIILVSLFAINELFSNHQLTPEFFVGVEFAYSDNASDLKDLVDKVKNYTNLFVIGTPEISLNQTALNETCDYIYDAGLYFIVLITDSTMYSYSPFIWIAEAKQKYGDRFVGIYRYDEPGGNQLDQGRSRIVANATDYADAAANYTKGWSSHIVYWNYSDNVITADYGLYWFDYKSGYDAVLAEFGSNQSRELNVALCRGAAKAQNKDWGAIVTWTYDHPPYIESRKELYDDMTLAYHAGAKYVVVFDYPKIWRYGILTDEHFDALKNFWNYIHGSPQDYGVEQGKVAYVLPSDYGFGFRSASDNIWGLWNADDLSPKIWDDANKLLSQYDSRLDIVYNDTEFINAITRLYDKLIFWNETLT
jgi:hypothetical protein